MTLLFPSPDTRAVGCVVGGTALDGPLSWNLRSVRVSPPRSAEEYALLSARTFGSSWDWGDEYLFADETGLLQSVILRVPEENLLDEDAVRPFLCAPAVGGLPRLENRGVGFNVDSTDVRHLTGDGSALIALSRDRLGEAAPGDITRVSIHPALDLLTAEGELCGCVPRDPGRHLGDAPVAIGPAEEASIIALVRRYMDLVCSATLEQLEGAAPGLQSELLALSRDAGRSPDAGGAVMAAELGQILDTFYSTPSGHDG